MAAVRLGVAVPVVAGTIDPIEMKGRTEAWLRTNPGIEVVLANLTLETGRYQLAALFPLPFDRSLLGP